MIGAGWCVLAVGASAVESFDSGRQSRVVVVNQHQIVRGIAVERVVRRHLVFGVLIEKLQPRLERPRVEQCRLGVEEVLDLPARHRDGRRGHWAPARSAAALIWCCQRRQNTRICSSSFAIGTRPMPREMSFHSTPPLVKPCWQDSSASRSSGGAKPPGPGEGRKVADTRRGGGGRSV